MRARAFSAILSRVDILTKYVLLCFNCTISDRVTFVFPLVGVTGALTIRSKERAGVAGRTALLRSVSTHGNDIQLEFALEPGLAVDVLGALVDQKVAVTFKTT